MSQTKILIVDDEIKLIEMVKMHLEANAYEVTSATDGQMGLEKAKSENPDLILLDIMMPKMDGYKVCGLLKNDARYSKIPVILFTARADQKDDVNASREARANAYITKPFEPAILLAKIEELLKESSKG